MKFKSMSSIGIITMQLIISSCSTLDTAFNFPGANTTSTIAFHETSAKSKDNSILYIYRQPSMVGAATS